MRIVIDSLGEQAVARELIGIDARGLDMRPAMDDVLDMLRTSERRQFDSQGVYGSGGWAPLAAATIARKQRAGHDPRILHATHRLRDSLTERGNPEELALARRDGADFGSLVPYAGYHQTGTSHMPRRRPAQLPETDRRQVIRILQRYVIENDAERSLL